MESTLLSLFTAAVLTWLLVSLGLWIWAIRQTVVGREVLPAEPRRTYPGGLAEVLIAAGVYMLVGALLGAVLGPQWLAGPPDAPPDPAGRLVPMIVLNGAATITAVVVVLAWIACQGFSPRQWGLIPKAIDLLIGVAATVMLLPPIFIIQGVLSTLIEYHHPLLEVLQRPQPWTVLLAMGISSTLIAPLAEEFFFRGLLQGWLGTLSRRKPVDAVAPSPANGAESHALAVDALAPDQPYQSSHVAHLPPERRQPWWPIVVSSLVFAVVHLGQGPAPITLFFLSLGLGYLYRQTGRIWAPIVVHMGLNGLTTVATILSTASQ